MPFTHYCSLCFLCYSTLFVRYIYPSTYSFIPTTSSSFPVLSQHTLQRTAAPSCATAFPANAPLCTHQCDKRKNLFQLLTDPAWSVSFPFLSFLGEHGRQSQIRHVSYTDHSLTAFGSSDIHQSTGVWVASPPNNDEQASKHAMLDLLTHSALCHCHCPSCDEGRKGKPC
jgi:hypothetical protein